jgi:hypothetical protein
LDHGVAGAVLADYVDAIELVEPVTVPRVVVGDVDDDQVYRHRVLHPLAWLVEHTISTPATHFAHHALVQDDGIGHYTGN